MSSHTPGPWKARPAWAHASSITGTWLSIVDGPDNFVAADVRGVDANECNANARLIAAAPDLLEALEAVLMKPKRGEWMNKDAYKDAVDRQAKAIAAIAKAKGTK